MEVKILVCSNCGAKISTKDLDYAFEHDGRFPEDKNSNTIHMNDCGCRYADEVHGDACHCDFIDPVKEHVKESEGEKKYEEYR